MGIYLEKAWIILYKENGQVKFDFFKEHSDFERKVRELWKKGIRNICCIIPTALYFPFYVEEVG